MSDLLIASVGPGTMSLYLGNSTISQTLSTFSLRTQAEARSALDSVTSALSTISSQQGNIGAQQSRFLVELSNLRQSRDTAISARSRIVDADISSESANLVRQRILQQAAIAVASHAAANPKLLLTLLGG